jgi:hypothetical protein
VRIRNWICTIFCCWKNVEFQSKIICKPSNINVALIKGRRGSIYWQQQWIPTSRFRGHIGADGRTCTATTQTTKHVYWEIFNTSIVANHVGGNGWSCPKEICVEIFLALLFELRSSNNGGSPIVTPYNLSIHFTFNKPKWKKYLKTKRKKKTPSRIALMVKKKW